MGGMSGMGNMGGGGMGGGMGGGIGGMGGMGGGGMGGGGMSGGGMGGGGGGGGGGSGMGGSGMGGGISNMGGGNDRPSESHRRSRTIFVGNLSDDVTDDTIFDVFNGCGDIESIRWLNDKCVLFLFFLRKNYSSQILFSFFCFSK
jgi:hypothetical protein